MLAKKASVASVLSSQVLWFWRTLRDQLHGVEGAEFPVSSWPRIVHDHICCAMKRADVCFGSPATQRHETALTITCCVADPCSAGRAMDQVNIFIPFCNGQNTNQLPLKWDGCGKTLPNPGRRSYYHRGRDVSISAVLRTYPYYCTYCSRSRSFGPKKRPPA